MKIFNNSCYVTADLRKFFVACLDREEKLRGRFPMRSALFVSVESVREKAKGAHICNGNRVWLYIVPPFIGKGRSKQTISPADVTPLKDMAMLFLHQIAHLRGYTCVQIDDKAHEPIATEVSLLKTLAVQKTAERPKKDDKLKRYQAVLNKVESKRKLYELARKRYLLWEQKRRRLELQMLRNGKLRPEELNKRGPGRPVELD